MFDVVMQDGWYFTLVHEYKHCFFEFKNNVCIWFRNLGSVPGPDSIPFPSLANLNDIGLKHSVANGGVANFIQREKASGYKNFYLHQPAFAGCYKTLDSIAKTIVKPDIYGNFVPGEAFLDHNEVADSIKILKKYADTGSGFSRADAELLIDLLEAVNTPSTRTEAINILALAFKPGKHNG